jgi:hypothetical protein
MKSFAVALGLSLVALAGCASAPKARTPDDAFTAMSRELSHTIDGDAVSTTAVTSAVVPAAVADVPLEPMQLPEERMPLSQALSSADDDLHLDSRH